MGTMVDADLGDLARRQHGVATRDQLLRLGVSPGALSRWVRAGRMRRLHRGVYAISPILAPHASEMAAVLACGTGALVSHGSAGALWGVIPAKEGALPVEVVHPGGNARSLPGVRVHRPVGLLPSDRARVNGIPVTSLPRTLLDLAAVRAVGELELAVARAAREHRLDLRAFARRVAQLRGRRGVRALRAVLEAEAGPTLTRSEAEARFLALVRTAGLPAPECNVRLGSYEIDFLWREEAMAVEVDGFRFHGTRRRFEHDRRRASWLASRGVQVVPLTWRQIVDEPMATAVQVGQALTIRAAERQVGRWRGWSSDPGGEPSSGSGGGWRPVRSRRRTR